MAGAPAPWAAPDFDAQRGVHMVGSADTMRKLLPAVVDSLSADLLAIDAALSLDDMGRVRVLFHGIKGFIPIFCSDALVAQVGDTESLSKTATAAEIALLYARLAPRLQSVLVQVKEYLAQGQH